MLRAPLLSLVAIVLLTPTLATQVPFNSVDRHNVDEWCLNKLPNPNATGNLVFETVHSLLQHWPNTRMRNGM